MLSLRLEQLGRLVRATMGDAREFKPCAFVNGLGDLYVLTEDCSDLEEDLDGPNSPFRVIRNSHTKKVVGVVVRNWGAFDKSEM